MCGIVGYIGPKNCVDVVLKGLERLEYRGYDSAGICIRSTDGLKIYKATGKISNLKDLIGEKQLSSNVGIGHTRWATHGGVVQENAHPHGNEKVAIVHNGIIENASDLKQMLLEQGFSFSSETDSEVFFNLICLFMRDGLNLKDAVSASFKKIKGNSAFVIIDKLGQEIITVKRSAPIVCGDNQEFMEAFVSSDPYALVGYAERLYFPEDEVICVISSKQKEKFSFFELDGVISTRFKIREQKIKSDECSKGNFEHFMLKEIFEQPALIRDWVKYYTEGDGVEILSQLKHYRPQQIHISACGTAWHAGLVIRDLIEKKNKIPVRVELASEFRYRDPLLDARDLGLFISQSGETADTIAAQELCAEKEMKTISIVNVDGSTLYRNCNENLLIRAGVEIGVASTKAFTLQVLTGHLFSLALAGEFDKEELKTKVLNLAQKMESLLDRTHEIQMVAEALYMKKGFIFTGRGKYYPVALEGALKLKEIAYVHAEGYAAGELKHGPIALIDDEMVNIAIVGPELFEKTVSNLAEVKARRGIILAIGPESIKKVIDEKDFAIVLDFAGAEEFHPLYVNVVNQLLSYYMAKFKGTDIDKPRNLAKSVTVE